MNRYQVTPITVNSNSIELPIGARIIDSKTNQIICSVHEPHARLRAQVITKLINEYCFINVLEI